MEIGGSSILNGGRANNSAVIRTTQNHSSLVFNKILEEKLKRATAGEPGMYFTNNSDYGTNPCCEIALKPFQFCNLTEVNVSNISSQTDLDDRVEASNIARYITGGLHRFSLSQAHVGNKLLNKML